MPANAFVGLALLVTADALAADGAAGRLVLGCLLLLLRILSVGAVPTADPNVKGEGQLGQLCSRQSSLQVIAQEIAKQMPLSVLQDSARRVVSCWREFVASGIQESSVEPTKIHAS